MRTGNPVDGMYLLLLVVPFVLCLWLGDLVRKKLVAHLVTENHCSRAASTFLGTLGEILVIAAGVTAGLILIKLI